MPRSPAVGVHNVQARYTSLAHGVRIDSAIPLSHAADSAADASDTDMPVIVVSTAGRSAGLREPAADEISLRAEDGVVYRMRAGSSITVCTDDSSASSIPHFITGPALATILFQRGSAVLHASCVRNRGRLIAFAGPSGVGKSTLAAEFVRRGWDLVADDFIALSGSRLAHSGQSRLRLWPDAAAAMGLEAGRAAGLPSTLKPEYSVLRRETEPLDARPPAIFMLTRGECLVAKNLTPDLALYHLLGNSYCAPYFDQAALAEDFPRWTALAREADCRELCSREGLEFVGAAADLVEACIAGA